MTQELQCGCDKLLLPYFERGNTIQTAIFTFPEADVAIALELLEQWDDKKVNDMLDVFDENMNYNFNPMYQFLYNALEVFEPNEIFKMLEIIAAHRKH